MLVQKLLICLLLSEIALCCIQITSVSLSNGGERTDFSEHDEIAIQFIIDGGSYSVVFEVTRKVQQENDTKKESIYHY